MNGNHARRMDAAAAAVGATTEAFLAFLDALPAESAVQALAGGWTPAGHAAHLAMTNNLFRGILEDSPESNGIQPFKGQSAFPNEAWTMDSPPRAVTPPILVPPVGISRIKAAMQLADSLMPLQAAMTAAAPGRLSLCVQLPWAVVTVSQMCEWASGHTVRHLVQVTRELHLAATKAAAIG
jgi:hypothetical protein